MGVTHFLKIRPLRSCQGHSWIFVCDTHWNPRMEFKRIFLLLWRNFSPPPLLSHSFFLFFFLPFPFHISLIWRIPSEADTLKSTIGRKIFNRKYSVYSLLVSRFARARKGHYHDKFFVSSKLWGSSTKENSLHPD